MSIVFEQLLPATCADECGWHRRRPGVTSVVSPIEEDHDAQQRFPMRGSDRTPTLAHAAVGDVMHPGVITCPPDAELTEVSRLMASDHVHAVVVLGLERSWAGERMKWGLITDLDLVAAGLDPLDVRTAADIATGGLVLVEPQEPFRPRRQLMVEHHLPHLLVVARDTGRPLGMLSTLDVAGCMAWGEA